MPNMGSLMSYTKLQDILLQHKSNISLPFEHEYGEHLDLGLLMPKYKSKLSKKLQESPYSRRRVDVREACFLFWASF